MREIGIEDNVTIPRINATLERRNSYQSYYTTHARRLVEYVFRPDLKRYGYSFEGLDDSKVSPQKAESWR
jgi:hypothetical protein